MPPVWLGIQSRNGSSNNPFGGQVGNGSGNRVLFIPDRSLALFDNQGTFEDVFGEDGLKAPQLSTFEYQDITDELKEQKHIPYRIVTDSQGNEQLIVFASPGPRNRGLPMVQMGTATKPLRDLIIKQAPDLHHVIAVGHGSRSDSIHQGITPDAGSPVQHGE